MELCNYMEWEVGFVRSVSYAIPLTSPLYWKKVKSVPKRQTWGSAFILKNSSFEKLHTTINGGKQYNTSPRSWAFYTWLQLRRLILLIFSTQCELNKKNPSKHRRKRWISVAAVKSDLYKQHAKTVKILLRIKDLTFLLKKKKEKKVQMVSSRKTNFNQHPHTLIVFTTGKFQDKIGEKTDLHLRIIFKKIIFILRNNGGKVVFHFCWGEATEALFIANS